MRREVELETLQATHWIKGNNEGKIQKVTQMGQAQHT